MARRPDAAAATRILVELARSVAGGAGSEPLPDGVLLDGANVSAAALGSAEGQAWRVAATGGIRLGGVQLAGASLRGADLSGADLSLADLSRSVSSGLVLVGARLEGANLRGADLVGGDLDEVHAGQADFSEALLEDAKLRRAGLRFAVLDDAVMDGADFSDADLWGAGLQRVAAERACLRGARLDEARLDAADLAGSDLGGASLRRAHLGGARLRRAELRGAVLDGADCTGADFSGAVLPYVSLASCTLTHARFAGAWLERTRMRAHQLGGAAGEEAAGHYAEAVDCYVVLEQNFRSLGNAEDARWAFRRRRRMGKRLAALRTREAWQGRQWRVTMQAGLHWLTDILAEWLCDYGESVPRVLRALLITLGGFAALYWVTGTLVPRQGAATGWGEIPAIDYLLFSLDSMTTVGTSEVGLRAAGQLGVLLSSVQSVLGTILLGLFGFVLGVRMRN